jgi:Cytochrome P450
MINTPKFLLGMQRRYGDSCSFFLSRRLFIGLFSPSAVHEVTVAQQHKFVKGVGFARMRKVLGEGLLTNEEPIHLAHRRMMQPPFHHGNLDSYVAIMHELVSEHTKAWEDKKSIELAPEMMALTLEIVSRCLFGLDSHQYTEAIASLWRLRSIELSELCCLVLIALINLALSTLKSLRWPVIAW